ncbi:MULTISPECIES: polysaccharide deacetylase family protein [Kitasatospora]|uniref:Putative hydrolase n=1 Tax=Kitasatospora setae (strain ATCC 33774 / DSM 43861 / JCM 3304 / KCC A-0304 / NBRC 14216 / KM-6054) TaxID=452652 RepID=E4N9E5_KITSK|nr:MULTISPECIES: polysaccharide deacetylase family protein [Kitasatospora]BAJ27826.1 putative hydrolase [Kitasatospora setae KM-6054]
MVKSRIPNPRRPLLLGAAALLGTSALLVACGAPGSPTAAGDAAHRSASPSASGGTTGASGGSTTGAARPTPGADESSAAATATPTATSTPTSTRTPSASPAGTPTGAPASPFASATTSPTAPSAPAASAPAASPSTHAPATGVLRHTASGGRTVALTFDDGPGPATGQVLDLLAQYGAKATFCEIGTNAQARPAAVQRILAEGHRLCDHTVDHPQPMHAQTHEQQVAEIGDAKAMIEKAAGGDPAVTWWRAPGGDFTAENERIGADLGMKSLGWTVDPRDWARPGVQAIVSNVQQNLRPGGVVLMHDGGGDRTQTVAALKQLLPWLVAQGYTFDFPQS